MLRPGSKSERKSVGLSIDCRLIDEANALGMDMSSLAEAAIAAVVSAEKTRRWQEENKEAIDSWNDYVRRHGLPLAKDRLF
ncbi:type II toxin-antitoxin system CcdA family antitoxin [Mesorhizobium argentiipisi]|uniref:Type II toxin-antitoxin system CcdA family antitoxin n=1 Tax=Mesorhizobium argentiipisi TaxID=3015175 RepID=A0ABU8KN70_9HYPH